MATPIWYSQRADVIDAIERGTHTVEKLHTPVVGPVSWDRIDYPFAQILPESSDYQGGNEWTHQVRLNCVFERQRWDDYYDQLLAAMEAVDAAMTELAGVNAVVTYLPTLIEDFAGERDDTGLLMISVRLEVGTLVDLAEET